MPEQPVRCRFKISGAVQGVGFRPFVFNLAAKYCLGGRVYNDAKGVVIDVEGDAERVAGFDRELETGPPPPARIDRIIKKVLPVQGCREFFIELNSAGAAGDIPLPPDLAVCPVCRKELADPGDRRFRYSFINCTACGPRLTIVESLPYDRCRTSMKAFPMCPECTREYRDPADRRFHAQPAACPACGPQAVLVDRQGHPASDGSAWLTTAGYFLKKGRILAVKGLGGFHLSCDAANPTAVAELRRRKGRPTKPFAVMFRDLEIAEQHCHLTQPEAELLRSPAAPIVLLRKRTGCNLPPNLAPGLNTLGVMLPYTPLHLLLLQEGPPALVMTSGNRGGLPLVADNRQALEQLGGMADYFLWHDRDIVRRCDDSVTALIGGESLFFRRSRGCVPLPLDVPVDPGTPAALGIGGDMKNAFCLVHRGRAYLSQHIGEVDNFEGLQNLAESVDTFCRLISVRPVIIACDLHPEYRSSKLAGELAAKLGAGLHPGVQHHHAHLASCMAENVVEGEVIGIILDGTGYGPDGRLRGFEVMAGGYRHYRREYHLAYVPLPGGEQAVRNPWLTAVAYLMTFLGQRGKAAAKSFFPDRLQELLTVEKMLAAGFNSPPASSCGRLFDAVAALLGLCSENTYEGEAAVLLGSLAPWFPAGPVSRSAGPEIRPYPFTFQGASVNPAPALEAILADISRGTAALTIARRFHDTIIAIVLEAARRVREKTGLSRVALSGGTWQNRYLLGVAKLVLEYNGFTVFQQRLVPPGDGGLSLGQALIACKQLDPRF